MSPSVPDDISSAHVKESNVNTHLHVLFRTLALSEYDRSALEEVNDFWSHTERKTRSKRKENKNY